MTTTSLTIYVDRSSVVLFGPFQINLVKPLEATISNYLDPKHELLTHAWDRSQAEVGIKEQYSTIQ